MDHKQIILIGWKNKKAATNATNEYYNKCFPYTTTTASSHEEIGKHSERISKIKPFIDKYSWKHINCPSGKGYWIKFGKYSAAIVW